VPETRPQVLSCEFAPCLPSGSGRPDVLPMRLVSPDRDCADCTETLMRACFPEWWGAQHSERMGNTPTSPFASPPDPQGRLQGRRRPPPAARPAGQTPGLRRAPCLPARAAGRRLEHPPTRHPPGHHPGGHPPRHRRPPPPPATPPPAARPPAARPPASARRPPARRGPGGRTRLPRCAGLPAGPAGHPRVDACGGGRRAWRCPRHPAAPAGPAAGAAGGADPAAARRRHGGQGTAAAGAGGPAAPGSPGRARLRGWTSICGTGLWGGAGRCGGWAPSSGSVMAGWTSS
jgi:hypothetical protein